MNNPLSYSSLKLELFSRDNVRQASASGFVLEAGSRFYLVTNLHVLTGRDASAGEPQRSESEPYLLKTSLHLYDGYAHKAVPFYAGMRKKITIPLYDESGTPRWIEPRVKEGTQPLADIAVLPIRVDLTFTYLLNLGSKLKDIDIWTRLTAIPLSAIDTDVDYGPPDTVYVVGYPLGWEPAGTGKTSSAFWRTSSIASELQEPGVLQSGAFYIDPCPPQGMTGSPVVGLKNDRPKLLGIYSDVSTAEFAANAGLVWDAFLIKGLIDAFRR